MRGIMLALVLAAGLAIPAGAQTRPANPPPFETVKDAYDRQRSEDYRARQDNRSLLQNERVTPLGDTPVRAVPAPERYTTQPEPTRR